MARGLTSYRSPILGTTHMVSAGHYLAAAAGYRILEDGGNAIDAGRRLRHRHKRHPAPTPPTSAASRPSPSTMPCPNPS